MAPVEAAGRGDAGLLGGARGGGEGCFRSLLDRLADCHRQEVARSEWLQQQVDSLKRKNHRLSMQLARLGFGGGRRHGVGKDDGLGPDGGVSPWARQSSSGGLSTVTTATTSTLPLGTQEEEDRLSTGSASDEKLLEGLSPVELNEVDGQSLDSDALQRSLSNLSGSSPAISPADSRACSKPTTLALTSSRAGSKQTCGVTRMSSGGVPELRLGCWRTRLYSVGPENLAPGEQPQQQPGAVGFFLDATPRDQGLQVRPANKAMRTPLSTPRYKAHSPALTPRYTPVSTPRYASEEPPAQGQICTSRPVPLISQKALGEAIAEADRRRRRPEGPDVRSGELEDGAEAAGLQDRAQGPRQQEALQEAPAQLSEVREKPVLKLGRRNSGQAAAVDKGFGLEPAAAQPPPDDANCPPCLPGQPISPCGGEKHDERADLGEKQEERAPLEEPAPEPRLSASISGCLPPAVEDDKEAAAPPCEAYVPEVGDIVTLGPGAPKEFRLHQAVVTKAEERHCTVVVLDESGRLGVGECWPMHVDVQLVSKRLRLGGQVLLEGLNGAKTRLLNGCLGTVIAHPREGHPSFVRKKSSQEQAVLTVCVRLDSPPAGCDRTVLLEPRFVIEKDWMLRKATEDLGEAIAALTPRAAPADGAPTEGSPFAPTEESR